MRNNRGAPANDEPTASPAATGRRIGRRKVVGAITAGLVVVLGGGAVVTSRVASNDEGAGPQRRPAGSPVPGTSPSPPGLTAASPSATAAVAADAVPRTDRQRTVEMQGQAAKASRDGTLVHRSKPGGKSAPVVPDYLLTVQNFGDMRTKRATLRVVSARADLTGQRELAWVVGAGEPVGGAQCTQKIQLSNNPKPKVRPSLLICWRTSAKRSAYTVAVDLNRAPSKAASVAALNEAWARLR
jgi:hypothetical protein